VIFTPALKLTYLIPAFAIVWGRVILKEPITASMVFGCGLILFGTAIANDLFKGLLAKS
jgi:drug/metabolite transporter (DMT)-like permease